MNNIYLDANYFLRYLLDDQPLQANLVEQLFIQASQGHAHLISSTLVFFEVNWVFKSVYHLKKTQLINQLRKIINLNMVHFEEIETLHHAIDLFENSNLSLEDSYHLIKAKSTGCDTFGSFDQLAVNAFKKL